LFGLKRAKALFVALLFGWATLVAVTLAPTGVVAKPTQEAAEVQPVVDTQSTLRRLAWAEQHIDKLNKRNAFLHRYIDGLREQLNAPTAVASSPPVSSTTTTSTSSTSSSTASYPSGNSGCLSATQVADYARAAGFPESAISTMVYYASRESGYCPGAINSSSGACGLWQLYPCSGGSAWLDPATNARLAYQKYAASGFSPWGG
jgi:hypothetical protein